MRRDGTLKVLALAAAGGAMIASLAGARAEAQAQGQASQAQGQASGQPAAAWPQARDGQASAIPPRPVPPLSDFFEPIAGKTASPDADGFIRRWLILEPVNKPNPTNTVFTTSYVRNTLSPANYPGNFSALPRAGQTVTAAPGEQLRWHALDSKLWDVKLFNFAQALGKPKYGVVFWVATVVNSPREMRGVRLAAGSNSASVWWLNGTDVATLADDRRMVMDDVLSDRITLRKGRNVIRGAIINGPGLSDFCLRFVDGAGQPIRDLSISTT